MSDDLHLLNFRIGWQDRDLALPQQARKDFSTDAAYRSYCNGWDAHYQDEEDSKEVV